MAPTSQNETPTNPALEFPSKADTARLQRYARYDLLQDGRAFDAFNITLENDLNKKWGHLRYVAVNFAGLISKVVSDMLFGEPIKFKFKDKDNQAFMDALAFQNKLHLQNYESALSNSARGDALFKLRTGKLPGEDKDRIIIEEVSPYIYFPECDPSNMRGAPTKEVLAWPVVITDAAGKSKTYLRKEIHEVGKITNELWQYEEDSKTLKAKLPWKNYYPGIPEVQDTKIKKSMLVHIPNYRKGSERFGISDYNDLEQLLFAINNRLTKVDNILDKHSDPILAIPEGVMDEEGNVKKERLGMIEIPSEGDHNKPEYIVWNANLESAFTEIEKLVDFLFMISEIAPDALGMGKGQSDTGRALKLKLLRTIAKAKRKQLYYSQGLKEIATVAQMLAKAHNITAENDGEEKKAGTKLETPEIEFSDGIVRDTFEAAQEEQIRLTSGTTTKKDAIMRLDGVDEDTAERKVKEIQEEEGLNLPLAGDAHDHGDGNSDPNANMPDETDESYREPKPPTQPPLPKGK